MSWAFWKHFSDFPSHEKLVVIVYYIAGLYIQPIVFPECAHFLCVISMKNLLKVFATAFQVFLSFLANEQLCGKTPKTVKLRRGLIFFI